MRHYTFSTPNHTFCLSAEDNREAWKKANEYLQGQGGQDLRAFYGWDSSPKDPCYFTALYGSWD